MSQHGNNLARQRRMKAHAEHGWRDCTVCGTRFLPPYGPGKGASKYCDNPDCQETKSDRAKESRAQYAARSMENGTSKHKSRGRQWKCRLCGKMSDNRLDCPQCRARIVAKNGNCLDDFAGVQTIDICNMGLMPY